MPPDRTASFLVVAALLPEPLFLVSAGGEILAANAKAAELLRAVPSELVGRLLGEFSPDPQESLERYLSACSRNRQMLLGKLTLSGDGEDQTYRAEGAVYQPRSDASPALVLLRLTPRASTLERFVLLNQRIDELTEEISTRRRMENALRESEERFRVAATLASDHIYEWDLHSDEVRWFTDVAGWLGYSREELPPCLDSFQRILHPDDRERVRELLEQVRTRGTSYREEIRFVARDGSIRHIIDNVAVLRDSQGRPVKVIGVNTDITEQRRGEEALAQASRQQRRFLREMLFSLTEGRLRLCEDTSDLPSPLVPTLPEEVPLSHSGLIQLRQRVREAARAVHLSPLRCYDLVTGVHEAAMNAVVHGGGGIGRIFAHPGSGAIQVWILDQGGGITEDLIHRATLERGWTTAGSLGHGFWLMLRTCDRIYLLTGAGGTTVVLEQEQEEPAPAWKIAV